MKHPHFNQRHGHKVHGVKSPTYSSWESMKYRCGRLHIYRGLTYDPRWESFDNFLADMGERPTGTTLDRIDGSKNYAPGNCRWATWPEQNRNRHINVRVNGKLLLDIAKELGLKYQTAYWRLNHGKLIIGGAPAKRD